VVLNGCKTHLLAQRIRDGVAEANAAVLADCVRGGSSSSSSGGSGGGGGGGGAQRLPPPRRQQRALRLRHVVCWSTETHDEAARVFGLGFLSRFLLVRRLASLLTHAYSRLVLSRFSTYSH